MFNKNIFSKHLLYLRKYRNISQSTLGEAVGISFHTISKIEKGDRAASIEVLYSLADYFEVPIDYLVGRGFFENWEEIMNCKEFIFQMIEETLPNLNINLQKLSERDLIDLFPALFESIIINGNHVELTFKSFYL